MSLRVVAGTVERWQCDEKAIKMQPGRDRQKERESSECDSFAFTLYLWRVLDSDAMLGLVIEL